MNVYHPVPLNPRQVIPEAVVDMSVAQPVIIEHEKSKPASTMELAVSPPRKEIPRPRGNHGRQPDHNHHHYVIKLLQSGNVCIC